MAAINANTPIAVSEFSACLEPLAPTYPLAVAVSGGADSMALAFLAHEIAPITALTMDHGLRPESAAEAAQVGEWLAHRNIAHHTLKIPQPLTGNIQSAAREARYRLMAEWCLEHSIHTLLVAHHRDDQAETVLLRLKRGSHVTGLSAMRPVFEHYGLRILRPLLHFPKRRLIATLQSVNQLWIEDPSNRSPYYDRNRLRNLLHALPNYEDIAAQLACASTQLANVRDQQQAEIQQWIAAHVDLHPSHAQCAFTAFSQIPAEQALALLSHLIRYVGGGTYSPRFSDLERLYAALMAPHCKRTLGGCIIARVGEHLSISHEKR